MQVFLLALELWAGDANLRDYLTEFDLKELNNHFHAVHENNMYGATGGLLYLKTIWPWLQVEAGRGVLETPESQGLLQFGDVLSIQQREDPWAGGHSMTVLETRQKFNKKDEHSDDKNAVVLVFDSYDWPDKSWLCKEQKGGPGFNWWMLSKRGGPFPRTWYFAGIRNEGWFEDEVRGW